MHTSAGNTLDPGSLPPKSPRKLKPFSVPHWQWRIGQEVIARIPWLRRNLPHYRAISSAYDGAEGHGFTERHVLPHPELRRQFMSQGGSPFDLDVMRRVNLLFLHGKTVMGATGNVIDERSETLVRFMGERDHVARNDFLFCRQRPVEKPDGLYFNFIAGHRGHAHIYHFIFERLKALYYLVERFGRQHEEIRVLVRPDLPDYQRKVLEAIGRKHDFLRYTIMPPDERWRIGTLCHVDVGQNALMSYSDPDYLAFLRDVYLGAYDLNPTPGKRRRLFISRDDTKLRRFANPHEVHAVLERHGFEFVHAAQLSYRDQIETFRDAGVIAGTHGAGLTNIVFSPPEAPLIEFLPSTRMYPAYLQLSLAQGRPYHWLRGGPGGRQERFLLDPDELDKLLSRVL